MPARDLYHENVRKALIADGWTITDDPYILTFGKKDVYVDLSAERPIAAEKEGEKIAVEVKTFRGASETRDLENAVGQFVFYRSLMARVEPDRKLFMAVTQKTMNDILDEQIARPVLEDERVALIVFDPDKEVIVKWIP
jgi:hypothetical protein